MEFFNNKTVYKHSGKHFVPSKNGDKKEFVTFFTSVIGDK